MTSSRRASVRAGRGSRRTYVGAMIKKKHLPYIGLAVLALITAVVVYLAVTM